MFKFFRLPKVQPANITPLIKQAEDIDAELKDQRKAFKDGQKHAKEAFEDTIQVVQELLEERKADGRDNPTD
jgi:hypothetical protein